MTSSFKAEDIFSVQGKTIVVTGGGTGLGRAIASGFIANGSNVIIIGRRKDVLESAAREIELSADKGGSIIIVQGDVATKASVAQLVASISAKVGAVDTLVNCAGVMRPFANPADPNNSDEVSEMLWSSVEDDDFNYTNSINVNGVYFMTAGMVPLLRKSALPNVIVIAPSAGVSNTRAIGSVSYGASKAGTIHLAALLAGRLSPTGIRVNTINPGLFPSEMTGGTQVTDGTVSPLALGAAQRSTAGRVGEAQEIVGPCLLLASKAGGFMNNAVLLVDGGRVMVAGLNDGVLFPDDAN